MSTISISKVGKAYKQYPNRWARLAEWLLPIKQTRHTLKWVLNDVSFTVNSGESIGIVGKNGAGKSTLLKMITGTTTPTTGSIQLTGRVAALLELGMGFHPDFTGRQNVYISGQLLGMSSDEISRCMPQIESFAEIGVYIDQPVRVYSSGMQMRLAFSVATAIRPDILIVDEALAVGDARFQAKCYSKIAAFKKKGTTLLLVSHNVNDIVKHCERALFIKDGHIAMEGAARDVTNCYLDELFGKNTLNQTSQAMLSNKNKIEENISTQLLLENKSDVYHTRPGYRKEEYRWGHGGAKIIDYDIQSQKISYPSNIQSNTQVDFYLKVIFDRDFDNVIPGLLIKTLDGLFLYGTNSFLASEGKVSCTVRSGDIRIFKFSFPLNLNNGDYLLSLGISSGACLNTLEPLDRRYDSIILHVSKDMEFWGIIDLQSTFQISS